MYSEFTKRLLDSSGSFDFVAAHFACEADKYSTENPAGFVNLGSAQNFLSKTAIEERLSSLEWLVDDTPYRAFAGTDSCRAAVASYLKNISGRIVGPNHIVVGNGMISVLESLSIAILDAGDSVLVTTPVFPGLVTALTSRTQANFIPLETGPETEFKLSPEVLRAKLENELNKGSCVKAVLLCSPGNPIGQVFTADEIGQFVDIAGEFNVALIVDEIYASSCFSGVDFVSALSVESDNVITIGGLSKDFGLAGYTTAWACTTNEYILRAMKKQSHFYRLAAPVQRAIEVFLDPAWRVPFTNSNREKLTSNYVDTSNALNEIGVKVTPSQAGLVSWLDLTPFLRSEDEQGQLELYRYLLEQHRVHISPASGFYCSKPGFFRICFSQEQETLREGLRRIQQGLRQFQNSSNIKFLEV